MQEYCFNHDVAVYGGYIDDESMVKQSASGGIATAMAYNIIKQGGYVAGVAYSEDFYSAEYIIVDSENDINRLKGSKYIECENNSIFQKVKTLLDSEEKVLFFGLPCMVAAIYKFLGKRPENLLTCELICHGPTSPKVHKEYVEHLEKQYKSKVVDFSVRYKKEKWTPPYLYAKFEDGSVFEYPFYSTEYGFAFSVLGREACYNCKYKGNNRQGDLMIGDLWGAKEGDLCYNKMGTSVIFAKTEKGNDFIKSLSNIKLFPITFEKAIENNPMVMESKSRMKNRDKFAKLLVKKGLFYAERHCVAPKIKIRRALAKVVPSGLKNFLRKIKGLPTKD